MYDHRAVIEQELEADESLLWSAQPRQGIMLRPTDIWTIPFSLLWCGFAIFWEYQVLSAGALLMSFFGLPFVAVGIYMVAGRFIYDAKLRAKTFYGITDRRIIILTGLRYKEPTYLEYKEIEQAYLFEEKDGSGSIMLGSEEITTAWQNEMPFPGQQDPTPRLNNLADVRTPFALIQKQMEQLKTAE